MLTYPNIKIQPTSNFFWGVLPFRILVTAVRPPAKKINFSDFYSRYRTYLDSFKSNGVRVTPAYSYEMDRYSGRKPSNTIIFIYCTTVEEVESVISRMDQSIATVVSIAAPPSRHAYDVMAANPGCHVGSLFHGKYEWRISLKWMRDPEFRKFSEWMTTTFGGIVTDDAHFDKFGRRTLFLTSEDDVLLTKLTHGPQIVKTTRAISLNKNNNKEGNHETRTIPQTHREELDCTLNTDCS